MIYWLLHLFGLKPSWFVAQAKADQLRTNYPGCQKGIMFCLDQSCGCCELTPCRAFVRERAKRLEKEAK